MCYAYVSGLHRDITAMIRHFLFFEHPMPDGMSECIKISHTPSIISAALSALSFYDTLKHFQ